MFKKIVLVFCQVGLDGVKSGSKTGSEADRQPSFPALPVVCDLEQDTYPLYHMLLCYKSEEESIT